MKLRLPKLLSVAVLATLSCASVYAEINPADNIDYTLTSNGDGTYSSKVVIGDGVNTTFAGGVYVQQTEGNFNNTELRDVTIEMTGGKVSSILSASNYRANPVSGDVQMYITGGDIDTLAGGNHMNTAFNSSYIDSATLGNITINVGGNANVGKIRGGSIVGVDGGYPNEAYFQKYTTTGDININIKDNATVNRIDGAAGPDLVNGSLNINVEGGSVVELYSNNGGIISEDLNINVSGGKVTYLYDVLAGSVKGDVTTTISNADVYMLITSYGGTVENSSSTIINGGNVTYIYGVYNGTVKKDSSITINGGTLTAVYGTMGGTVEGDSSITINGGTISEVNGTYGGKVKGDVAVTVNNGTVTGSTTGSTVGTVEGNVDVTVNGGKLSNVYAANAGKVTGNTSVHLNGGTVTGYVYGGDASKISGTRTLYVGSDTQAYNGSVGYFYGFDTVIVAAGSSLTTTFSGDKFFNYFKILNHTYTLTDQNVSQAIATTYGYADLKDVDTLTLNLKAANRLKSGRYQIIDASNGTLVLDDWTAEKVIVNAEGFEASFEDLAWENNVLVFYYRGKDADTTLAANWGAFKSSQAFVNTLRGARNNSVVIQSCDGKGGIDEKGCTLAWGSVYSQSARISGIGADYSIFGAAVGAEHHFVSGRCIGVAMGYDWGKVSPFKMYSIDQDSTHLALYGRAAEWKLSQKGAIVLDWSAAVSNTTSETDIIDGDWNQKNLQLDARVSYQHELSNKTTGYAFAGVQYFAAEDATAGHVQVSSMQNFRTEIGAGVIYKATQNTTLRAEGSVYNDAMRHNPYVSSNGVKFNGTNPGRFGGSIDVGVNYQLNAKWNLHGNYSFDLADDSTEHNVNVGASYQF